MSDLTGQAGELRMSIEVTRKETGKVETFELIGFTDEEQLKQHQAAALVSGEQPKGE